MAFLSVSDLIKRYGRRQVVKGVSLEVNRGEVVGLLGANGAGKSTTFKMVVGLVPPDAGSITIEDRDVTRWPMYRRCQHGLGYLAQEPTIFAQATVEQNLDLIIEAHYPRRQRVKVRESLLDELGLKRLRASRAGALSGGERRRLEITRALVTQPQVLFFDEPFAGVDPKSRGDIAGITDDLKARGLGVLITDHHAEAILSMVDRLYVMESGTIIAAGTPREIVADERVRTAYLGRDFQLASVTGG
jgi:lipopolysaccharide export system ATP-binding protein